MTITTIPQTEAIVKASVSHVVFLNAATDLFRWFEEAVAGYEASADMDEKTAELDCAITAASDGDLPKLLHNLWVAYKADLKRAYVNFGRDVVHKHGFDEPAQVRNLALSIAGGAFQTSRTRAREFLVSQIEGSAS